MLSATARELAEAAPLAVSGPVLVAEGKIALFDPPAYLTMIRRLARTAHGTSRSLSFSSRS
ncbi:MAG: hypothetical protein ACOVOA_03755 [Allorhizobium sp.]